MRDPKNEDPKSRPQESNSSAISHLSRSETDGTPERAGKKKDWQNQQRYQKGSTPAKEVNTTDTSRRRVRNNRNRNNGHKKDQSQITCYNYDKKRHYADKCQEPKENALSKN